MTPTPTRRQFLTGIAGLGGAGLAGCIGVPVGPSNPGGPRGGYTPGQAGERFYQHGPPTRNGKTVTYDGGSHQSLQAAAESLTEGETLYIDPVNSPYVERLDLSSNIADHITIVSDGRLSFDSRGRATVEQEGAVIRRPDTNRSYAIGAGSSQDLHMPNDTSLTGSHSPGDRAITVEDTAELSPGDVIRIEEDTPPFNDIRASGGSYHPGTTAELRQITSIDGNTVGLNHQLLLPFPNENPTTVGRMDFHVEDIRISGLTIEGNRSFGDRGRPFYPRLLKDAWFSDIQARNSTFHGIGSAKCFRPRFNRIFVRDCPDRYGLGAATLMTHTYISNIAAENINRYVVRIAHTGGGYGSTDAIVDGVYGEDFNGAAACVNSHFGGFHIVWRNVTSGDGSYLSRMRSRYLTLDGFSKTGGGGPTFVFAQRPHSCTIRNGTVEPRSGSGYAFKFRLRDGAHSPRDGAVDERFADILVENVEIGRIGSTSITDIGQFEVEGNPGPCGPLTFRNVTYAGEQLRREHVTQWDGFDQVTIRNRNLAVE